MKMLWRAIVPLTGLLVLDGCSPHHHHGIMQGGRGEAYWQKGQQEMADLIEQTVKDPEKSKQVKSIVGEIVTELKAGREQERAYHRQLYTLNASYAATPEEFRRILDEGNNQRMRTATKVLGLRFKMKELMTADEWKALSDRMLSYSGRYRHEAAAEPRAGY